MTTPKRGGTLEEDVHEEKNYHNGIVLFGFIVHAFLWE